MLNSRTVALALGATFILVGLLGFVPNPLVAPEGLFAVNAAHNAVHLLTGAGFIGGAIALRGREDRVTLVIGALYAVVAVAGFLTPGDMLLGIVHINQADRWLHLGLAVAILAAGVLFKPSETVNV